MLDEKDEILLEQYIDYSNMTIDSRDKCIDLIRNIKENECSDFSFNKFDSRKYRIVSMSLKNLDGKVISFNGFVMNESEVRHLSGQIQRKNNKYFVATNFYRSNEYVDDDEESCYLSTLDIFTIKENKVLRNTHYRDYPNVYEASLELFDDADLYNYYYQMIHPNQLKLKNTND